MTGPGSWTAALRGRAVLFADQVRTTFGVPAALAMVTGLVAGLAMPAADRWLDVDLPLFTFSTQDAARGMLETIATATVAVAGLSFSVAIVAFGLFAAFIGHITNMLQPSSVIASIVKDGAPVQALPYPAGVGDEPKSARLAQAEAERMAQGWAAAPVRCDGQGYLTIVRADRVVQLAQECDGLVQQRIHGPQRTLPQDPGFPVREHLVQLLDRLAETAREHALPVTEIRRQRRLLLAAP